MDYKEIIDKAALDVLNDDNLELKCVLNAIYIKIAEGTGISIYRTQNNNQFFCGINTYLNVDDNTRDKLLDILESTSIDDKIKEAEENLHKLQEKKSEILARRRRII